jgi:hypothetical protein
MIGPLGSTLGGANKLNHVSLELTNYKIIELLIQIIDLKALKNSISASESVLTSKTHVLSWHCTCLKSGPSDAIELHSK